MSGVPACAGSNVTLTIAASGANPCSVLTAQLSSANGSFANPTSLGRINPGSNFLAIPQGTPAGSGYRIRVVSGNATSNSSAAFRVRTCTGSTRLAAEPGAETSADWQVSVSPNPTEGILRISVRDAVGQALKIELFNSAGQAIRQQTIDKAGAEETLSWDISRQPQGLYLLRVNTGQQAKTVKIVR
ncbi:MAG: T9SS type A sorting domain-containing protein [Cytophagaceae bacterium]|nr:T9SS type A sorting domain-containing protein [Cytophagaceae bacterium]